MLSLYLKNLFFIVLQPGLVVFYIPYLILNGELALNLYSVRQLTGLFIFGIGLIIMLHCIYRFIVEGYGTISPFIPTKKLVVNGLYKYSRNPMYLGVLIMLLAECFISASFYLMTYSLLVFLLFNLFIILVEEPRLIKVFGKEYKQYKKKVRRWF